MKPSHHTHNCLFSQWSAHLAANPPSSPSISALHPNIWPISEPRDDGSDKKAIWHLQKGSGSWFEEVWRNKQSGSTLGVSQMRHLSFDTISTETALFPFKELPGDLSVWQENDTTLTGCSSDALKGKFHTFPPPLNTTYNKCEPWNCRSRQWLFRTFVCSLMLFGAAGFRNEFSILTTDRYKQKPLQFSPVSSSVKR